MIAVGARVGRFFFDSEIVGKIAEKANIKQLGRAGALIRGIAKRLLRRKKTSSRPGQPPSVHSTNPIASLENILFAYDTTTHSMVVGPVNIDTGNQRARAESGTVPNLLERGGIVRITQGRKRKTTRIVSYRPRPFMQPAIEIAMPKLPELWANSVVK